ncbi:MAG: phosphatase PAP2 family protein [Deltaproteobacteria bacterium]|nr:phosphatase PAP2 family protein [Deltaproteobacteria bacterium]MCL5276790.1 phosphatase PAP2 family protein [Deltaproteobacteria bacterium]
MRSENHAETWGLYRIVDFYLRYEKSIITLFLVISLTCGFYYVDWHNQILWKEGMQFHELNTTIDLAVPFVPQFIWIYLLYYPLCFAPVFLLHNVDTFRRVAGAYLMEFVIAFAVFIVYPVKMIRPVVVPDSLSTKAVALLYRVDPGFNVFPSMHVANSLLVALIFYKYNRSMGVLFFLTAVLISVSTLYVKQHYLLDVVAGVFDAIIVYPTIFRGHTKWAD